MLDHLRSVLFVNLSHLMLPFEGKLGKELSGLSAYQLMVWGYLICEGLYPNYVAFHMAKQWGDPSVLREILDWLRHIIKDRTQYSPVTAQLYFEKVEAITPDTEDFSGVLGSEALDVCCAVLNLLEFTVTRNVESVVQIAGHARDTIDLFVQEQYDMDPQDPKLEERIENDEFMQLFLRWINKLTESVRNVDSVDDSFLNSLSLKRPMVDNDLLRDDEL